MAVKVAFFTAYRFEHAGHEAWSRGHLAAMDTSTNDDGTRHELHVVARDAGYAVSADGAARATPALPLGSLWRADIAGGLLNVMFEITEVTDTELVVRALNAARYADAGQGYCLLPETSIEFRFTREGCGFTNPQTSGINIYSGTTDIPKNCSPTLSAPNTIPLRGVALTGDFNPTCGKIIGGRVPSASIPRSALTATCSCLSPVVESCGGLDPSYMGNAQGLCAGCGALLTPKAGHCCVFCSYGSVPCPPVQDARACCGPKDGPG